MGRNGLLIDEMQNKVNTAKKCDPQSAFEMMLKADNLLTEINELMSNTGISGVSSIGYTSQSSEISRLQDNMEKLMDYPDMLIDNYFERFDGDFASGIQQSCEQLRNFYFDSIVYKNAASDELVERPLYQFSKIYARVNSAIDNIKEAPTGFLIVTARVNRNPAIKEKAEVELKERYRNLGYKGNDDLALMFPYLEMEDYIADFESNNPDIAEKIDAFLNHPEITERDDIYIRYYIYTADSQYRTMLINNIDDYTIANINLSDTAYFSPVGEDAGLNISYKENLYYSAFEPYNALFHEIGHATDYHNDKLGEKKEYDIEKFTMTHIDPQTGEEMQWTVRDAINYDVFENPNNPYSFRVIGDEYIKQGYMGNVENIIETIEGKNSNKLGEDDDDLSKIIQKKIRKEVIQSNSQAPSDIYGGLFGTPFLESWHHKNYYYNNVWDRNNANYNSPTKELWAEWFSYNLTGNEKALESTRMFFPTATEFLEEYVNENSN